MRRLRLIQDALLAALAVLGAATILALMAHVVADVARRNLGGAPIPATYEIVTNYYMIGLAFLPLAWVERRGGMVQVELIEPFLSPALRVWSDRLVALLSAAIYGALGWVALGAALRATATGTYVIAQTQRVPVWPATWMVPLGFGLAMLVTVLRLVLPPEDPAPETPK